MQDRAPTGFCQRLFRGSRRLLHTWRTSAFPLLTPLGQLIQSTAQGRTPGNVRCQDSVLSIACDEPDRGTRVLCSGFVPLGHRTAVFLHYSSRASFFNGCMVEPDGIEPSSRCLQSTVACPWNMRPQFRGPCRVLWQHLLSSTNLDQHIWWNRTESNPLSAILQGSPVTHNTAHI